MTPARRVGPWVSRSLALVVSRPAKALPTRRVDAAVIRKVTMRSLSIVSLVWVLATACGPAEAPVASSSTSPSSTPPVVEPVVEPAPPALPDDFRMSAVGGPVMAAMAAGMTLTHAELRPGAVAGSFELVEIAVTNDAMGMPGEAVEARRAPVARERVEALHRYVTEHLAALEGPCFDPTIMDGAMSRLEVTFGGTSHTFSCVNARTPEFIALSEMFDALVIELLPPPG